MAFRRAQPPAPRLSRRTALVRGVELAVFTSPEAGAVPPLLCVNGGILYGHEILWPALAPLARRRQLILYDQRGRGESAEPVRPGEHRIEDDAADIGALRKALGIGTWDVLAHSWGGGIALLGAERDQPGVRRIVTVDSVGPTSAWMKPLHAAALERLDATGRARLERFTTGALELPDPGTHSAHSRALYPAWFADRELAAMFAPPRSESAAGAAAAARLRREGYDWRPMLRALHRPVLVVHGDRDLLPLATAHDLAAVLPDARVAVMPASGHMPFWEAPEPFFQAVDGFLSGGRSAPEAREIVR